MSDRMLSDEILLGIINSKSGGGGGTSNYNDLSNQPQINNHTLIGNKSASDLGLVAAEAGKGLSSNNYTDEDKAIVGSVTAALAGKQDVLTAGNNIKIDDDTISVNRWAVPAGKVIYTVITSDENYGQNVHVQRHTPSGGFIDDRVYLVQSWQTKTVDDVISIEDQYAKYKITLLKDSDEQSAGYYYMVNPTTTPTSNSFTFTMPQEENDNDLIIRSELDAEVNAIKDGTNIDSFADVESALATKADLTDLAPAFSTATAYTVGQYVSYDGNIYKCTSAHSAGAWVAGDFTLVAVGSELESKQNATDNSLQTTDKTIPGAINELKSGLTNVQGDVKLNTQDLTTGSRTKNLLPLTLSNLKARNTAGTWSGNVYTCPNVAFTVNTNDDGLVTSISTTSSGSSADTMALEFKLPKGTYKLTSGFTETSGSTDTLLLKDNVVIARGNSASPGQTFTLASDSTVVWNIRATSSDITAYPMIRPATITDPTFAPYIPSVESRIEAVESGLYGRKLLFETASTGTYADKLDSIFAVFNDLTESQKMRACITFYSTVLTMSTSPNFSSLSYYESDDSAPRGYSAMLKNSGSTLYKFVYGTSGTTVTDMSAQTANTTLKLYLLS